MASKDVELRVRAKDEASAHVKKISDSLKILRGETDDVSKGAGKLSGSLGGLSGDVQKLQREMDRLKAVGQIATEFNRSSVAVEKLENSVRGSAAELAKLARQTEQASVSTTRFRSQIASEEAALNDNRRALTSTKDELRQVNALVRQAEKDWAALNAVRSRRVAGNVPSSGVGLETGAPASSARASMGVFLAADLASNRAAQAQLNSEIKNYQRAVDGSTKALKDLRPQASAAAANQRRLSGDTDKAANALRRQRDSLTQARGQLSTIDDVAREASTAMGGMVVTQENVSRSAQRMAAQLAAAKARIEGLAATKVSTSAVVDPATLDNTALENQRRTMLEARREWVQAQSEVKRLATEMRNAAAPTEAMGAAFGRAQAHARTAKDAFEQQRLTLHRLGGTAQSSFAQFNQAARQMGAAGAATAAANNQIASSANRANAGQRILAPAVRQTGAEMRGAAADTNRLNGALLGLGNGTRQSLSLLQRLRGEVLSLTASFVGFYAAVQNIGGTVDAFRDLEAIQSRLGAVFAQNTARVAHEVDWLRAQSDRLGISLSTLGNTYAKFAVAANAANFSQQSTRDIFLSVAEAGRVNKLSLDQLNGTFLAIEQIISKGKFTSEEVRRQLGDRLPGAFSILASAMGLTTAELDKMMSQGDLLATESNLMKFADEMTRRFGPQLTASLDTATTDIGRFENSVFKSQLRFSDGFIPALRDAIQAFNEFADSAEGRDFFSQLGVQIGRLVTILAEVPKYFDLITVALQAFVAVKLAGFILSTTRRVMEMRTAFTGLSQQMNFIGPQVQQMTMAQRILGQGFAQVIGSIDAYRARLLASTASTSTARMGTVAFANSLGVLRTAMMATAGVARAMWLAIGGLPGLVATGIVFAITGWITRTDEATAALTQHNRILEQVRAGYQAAGGDVDEWASKIENLTQSMAQANFDRLMMQWAQATRRLANSINHVRTQYDQWMATGRHDWVSADDVALIGDLIDLVDQFAAGEIKVNDFRQALDNIHQSTAHEGLRNISLNLQEMLDAADDGQVSILGLEQALDEARSVLKVFTGESEDAAEAADELGLVVDELNTAFKDNSKVETYTAAIDKLKGMIPELADEMERLKKVTDLNTTAWGGFIAAIQSGDLAAAGKIAGLWMQAAHGMSVDKMMEGLGGSSASASANLLKRFEGFRADAYPDWTYRNGVRVNSGYRAGYGSDTVTLADGSIRKITQGMTVTLADAQRDLARRIAEFQNVVKGQIGSERFDSFNEAQQAVLTSIAYNYGSLPDRIIGAILGGDQNAIANAIRGLSGDNSGINAGRRSEEAAIFAAAGSPDITPLVEAERERIELNEEQNRATQERLAANEFEISQQRLINDGRALQAEIEAAIAEARKENPNITADEIERIRQQTTELYNLKNITEEREAAETRVNLLYQLRQQLLEQLKMAEENGDHMQVQNLELRLGEVNTQLEAAIQNAIAMWQAVGGPQADAAIAKLQTMSMSIGQARNQMGWLGLSMQQWGQLAGSFADGLVGVFDSFAQAIANGENAVEALGKAFLQFAADFLRQIAQMILKQMILNALQSFFPGLPIGHIGGEVGPKAIGGGNTQIARTPQWMRHALTYHTGGIAGLRPDEVNATLRVGEEVLTEEDPRHRKNLGGDQKDEKAAPSIRQVLVLDPSEVTNALRSRAGETVVMTHIKANATTIKRMLGS